MYNIDHFSIPNLPVNPPYDHDEVNHRLHFVNANGATTNHAEVRELIIQKGHFEEHETCQCPIFPHCSVPFSTSSVSHFPMSPMSHFPYGQCPILPHLHLISYQCPIFPFFLISSVPFSHISNVSFSHIPIICCMSIESDDNQRFLFQLAEILAGSEAKV